MTTMTVSQRRPKSLPRNVSRSLVFRQTEDAEGDQDGLTIDGYATVYGRDIAAGSDPSVADGWAWIDNWLEGTFWERMRYQAFRKSLRERVPMMQYDHGRHPLLGSLPLGRWDTVTEEETDGLHTIGRVHDNWLTLPFRQAIKERSVTGMSIRFETIQDEWRTADGRLLKDMEEIAQKVYNPPEEGPLRRTIKEAKLLEAGPVTWPAYESTSVGMRDRERLVIDLGNLRDPGTQEALARAVYLADLMESGTIGDEGSPFSTEPAGSHRDDLPGATEDTSAGEHGSDDAPRTTDDGSAGEHAMTTDITSHRALDDVDLRRSRMDLSEETAWDEIQETFRGMRSSIYRL